MSELTKDAVLRTVHTFVLRAGRMTDAQKKAYETLSPRWCVPFNEFPINFIDVFDNVNPVTIEIGFGMGAATAIIAQNNPEKNYLGLEVHRPGVGRLLNEIEAKNLSNLYIIEHDAIEVLEKMIPDESVSAFHIFFPDPWPKKKHHKRRLVQRPRTEILAKKLAPGGYIYMATDWEPYAEFALEELTLTEGLKNKYDGYAPHQEWRPETKFENKGLKADRRICELFFEKI
jgi:tRNA (guanine-N7-)-methyltransferase